MAGVPTQIAVSGTPSATVYIWRADQRKYYKLGTASAKRALATTFQQSGLQKIRLVPRTGTAKTFQVPVYKKYPVGNQTPTSYGSVVLPSRNTARDTSSFTVSAADGCVLVDVGITVDTPGQSSVATVMSSGAGPATVGASDGAPGVALNIPVRGDAVIQTTTTPTGNYVGGSANEALGIVWTCL